MTQIPELPDEVTLDLELDEADDDASLRAKLAHKLGRNAEDLPEFTVVRRGIDARNTSSGRRKQDPAQTRGAKDAQQKGRGRGAKNAQQKGRGRAGGGRGGRVLFHLTLRRTDKLAEPGTWSLDRPALNPERVLIIGAGPAGLFCAFELARRGIGSTVVERGKQVQPRRKDLKGLTQHGRVDPDSNYCFGEGGAGTYSDGKLYTRAHKRGDVRDVLEILTSMGAPEAILRDARPHIGSNKLPKVITALRESLEEVGVVFRFDARVDALIRKSDGSIGGARLQGGEQLDAEQVVLATGHSARDIYALLPAVGVSLTPKGFAMGVRIEHPQPLINSIQYGQSADHPKLPSATYRLAHTEDGCGVFSFCMCPGGFIVPAATEADGVVVNGMSLSKRDSPFANSGIVVGFEPEDVATAGHAGPMGGIELQRSLERAAKLAGQADGERLRAPATRVSDFLAGKASSSVPETSYQPGLNPGDIREVLDQASPRIATHLKRALGVWSKRLHGFDSEEAVLVGVETRTSSPVRIERDKLSLQSPELPGLYPAGEGAGYAGGIVSAAMDGVRIARAIAEGRGPQE